MTPQKMRRLVVETAIPLSFNWVARDLNGPSLTVKVRLLLSPPDNINEN
jgi:hypothetical protein